MYKLEKLEFSFEALEPYIDTHTLALHHLKHQQNYLNKLNDLLTEENYDFKYTLEELNDHLEEFKNKEDISFNLGGVINHNLYFKSMSPSKEDASIFLKNEINKTFGSIQNFKEEFKKKALSLKGSGYTMLVLNNKTLEIKNFKNQENPYFYHLIPLITLDLWEHAYYLNYENKKDLYIDNFFNIMSFKEANKLFMMQI